jgi:hypothetical protein
MTVLVLGEASQTDKPGKKETQPKAVVATSGRRFQHEFLKFEQLNLFW